MSKHFDASRPGGTLCSATISTRSRCAPDSLRGRGARAACPRRLPWPVRFNGRDSGGDLVYAKAICAHRSASHSALRARPIKRALQSLHDRHQFHKPRVDSLVDRGESWRAPQSVLQFRRATRLFSASIACRSADQKGLRKLQQPASLPPPQCRVAAKAKQGPIPRKLSPRDCERFTTARRTFIQCIPPICARNRAWFSVRQIVVRSPGSTVTFGKDADNASPSGKAALLD